MLVDIMWMRLVIISFIVWNDVVRWGKIAMSDRWSELFGKVHDILKWKEMPDNHTFHSLMLVPIMVRYYGLMTTNADVTVEELTNYKL